LKQIDKLHRGKIFDEWYKPWGIEIQYSIDLDHMFGKSQFIVKDKNEILDESFEGIRLCNCFMSPTRFFITFGNILDIVKTTDTVGSVNILSQLEILDAEMIICCSSLGERQNYSTSIVNQEYTYWIGHSIEVARLHLANCFLIDGAIDRISEIILFPETDETVFNEKKPISVVGSLIMINPIESSRYILDIKNTQGIYYIPFELINNHSLISQNIMKLHCLFRVHSRITYNEHIMEIPEKVPSIQLAAIRKVCC
jgi:hypothetical protein